MTTKTHFQAGDAVFLLPEEVGSSVRWFVKVEQMTTREGEIYVPHIDMDISLADCSRVINWSEYGDGAQMEMKLDRAIFQLQAARKALKQARKVHKGLPRSTANDDE